MGHHPRRPPGPLCPLRPVHHPRPALAPRPQRRPHRLPRPQSCHMQHLSRRQSRPPLMDDDWDYEDDPPSDPPTLEVDIEGPQAIGVLLGPDGQPAWTLYDRPIIAFGFQPPGG